MAFLVWMAAAVVVGAAALGAMYFVGSAALRRRALLKGRLPEAKAEAIRSDYLESVWRATSGLGVRVDTRPFWRGVRTTSSQRYFLLHPLLADSEVIALREDGTKLSGFDAFLQSLAVPARYVCLSQRQYDSLLHSPAISIVVQGGNSGVILGSGRMQNVQAGTGNRFTTAQMTGAFVQSLIDALRLDSLRTEGWYSEQAGQLAGTLEREMVAKDKHRVLATVNIVAGLAASAAGVWASTFALLHG